MNDIANKHIPRMPDALKPKNYQFHRRSFQACSLIDANNIVQNQDRCNSKSFQSDALSNSKYDVAGNAQYKWLCNVSRKRKVINKKRAEIGCTTLPAESNIIENSPTIDINPDCERIWDSSYGKWTQVLFPAQFPKARNQTILLEQWMAKSLIHANQQHQNGNSTNTSKSDKNLNEIDNGESTKLLQIQMNILIQGLNELIRQVSTHCLQHGLLLEKIWQSLNDIFGHLVGKMEKSLCESSLKLKELAHSLELEKEQHRLSKYNNQDKLRFMKEELLSKHSNDVRTLIAKHTAEYTKNIVHEDTAKKRMAEVFVATPKHVQGFNSLQKLIFKRALDDLFNSFRLWFPHFDVYKDSMLAKLLPPVEEQDIDKGQTISSKSGLHLDIQRLQNNGLLNDTVKCNSIVSGTMRDLQCTRAQSTSALLADFSLCTRHMHSKNNCNKCNDKIFSAVIEASDENRVQKNDWKCRYESASKKLAEKTEELEREQKTSRKIISELQQSILSTMRDPGLFAAQRVSANLIDKHSGLTLSQMAVLELVGSTSLHGFMSGQLKNKAAMTLSLIHREIVGALRHVVQIPNQILSSKNKRAISSFSSMQACRAVSGSGVLLGLQSYVLCRFDSVAAANMHLKHLLASLLHFVPPAVLLIGQGDLNRLRNLSASEFSMVVQMQCILGISDSSLSLSHHEYFLWLRLFSALQKYIQTNSHVDEELKLPPDLVPLKEGLKVIESVFLLDIDDKEKKLDLTYIILHDSTLRNGLNQIQSTSEKHAGTHIEIWEAIEMSISLCWRPSHVMKTNALLMLYDIADLHNEMNFSHIKTILHVANPGLDLYIVALIFQKAMEKFPERGICSEGFASACSDLLLPCLGLQPMINLHPKVLANQCNFRVEPCLNAAKMLLQRALDLPWKERIHTDAAVLQARIEQVELFRNSSEFVPDKLWCAIQILDTEMELISACSSISRAIKSQIGFQKWRLSTLRKMFFHWKSWVPNNIISTQESSFIGCKN